MEEPKTIPFPEIEFDEKAHKYFVGGIELPSVTQILRFMNADVALNADRYMRDAAAERGRRIHEACMLYDYEGDSITVDSDIAPYVKAYDAFCKTYKPDWVFIERPVAGLVQTYSNGVLEYAGTLDRYGWIDGEACVVDIKTGTSGNSRYYRAQECAYSKALLQSGCGVSRISTLTLRSDGTFLESPTAVISRQYTQGLLSLQACAELHCLMKSK